MRVLVFNGWAASERAWDLCRFGRERIFSYRDHLSGATLKAVAEGGDCVIVGWSMGGEYALKLTLEFPEKVRGLVLVAATPRLMADGSDWPGFTPHKLAAFRHGLEYSLKHGPMGLPPGAPNPYEGDTEENLAAGLAFLEKVDLRPQLSAAKLTLPVRIFHSERDAIVKPTAARFLAGVFPNSTLETVPGTEHALPVVVPEKIDAAVGGIVRAIST